MEYVSSLASQNGLQDIQEDFIYPEGNCLKLDLRITELKDDYPF